MSEPVSSRSRNLKTSASSDEEMLEYIESMLAQLHSMSESRDEHFLSYLIEMAMQEAQTLRKIASGEVIAVSSGTSPEELAAAYLNGDL